MTRVPYKDYLDLSEHTTPLPGGERNLVLRYQLHGVVSHAGPITEGGHYVGTVKGQVAPTGCAPMIRDFRRNSKQTRRFSTQQTPEAGNRMSWYTRRSAARWRNVYRFINRKLCCYQRVQ